MVKIFKKKSCLFLVILFFTFGAKAQDISGVWTGNFGATANYKPIKIVVKLHVHQDSILTGLSHLYYRNQKYEHYIINGKYHKNTGELSISEDSTIAVDLGLFATNCLGTYRVKLSQNDSNLFLNGRWTDNSSSIFGCPSASVWFVKKKSTSEKKIQEIPLFEKDKKNLERPSLFQKLIEISPEEMDSIHIEIVDNADEDLDEISLYKNQSVIIKNLRITHKPYHFKISLSRKQPILNIKMAAESVGSYPPCTALAIIRTKNNKWEVELSSGYNANATIQFFLKE